MKRMFELAACANDVGYSVTLRINGRAFAASAIVANGDTVGRTYQQIVTQLAEEAAELAPAASKMIRIIDGANPTPVTPEAGWKKLLEESADVQVCLGEILSIADWECVAHTREEKTARWMQRLEERDNNETAL